MVCGWVQSLDYFWSGTVLERSNMQSAEGGEGPGKQAEQNPENVQLHQELLTDQVR